MAVSDFGATDFVTGSDDIRCMNEYRIVCSAISRPFFP